MGFDVNTKIGLGNRTCYDRVTNHECKMLLIDRGAKVPFSHPFIQSRNFARSSAILVMHAMYEMDKTYKHVSVIIARVIWVSRGLNEGV